MAIGSGAVAQAPNAASPVQEQFESLVRATDWIEKAVAELTQKIEPVLGPVGPPSGATGTSSPDVAICPVGDAMRMLFRRLSAIDDSLRSLVQRVEV